MDLTSDTCSRQKFVLGVDIGTTNIRCYAYDKCIRVIGSAHEKIPLIIPGNGRHEIDPDLLWDAFRSVVKKCLNCSQLIAEEISCIGISTQRATFLTWNKQTRENFHNFITWKDTRAEKLCDELNATISMKLFRFGAYILYLLTKREKFQIASTFKFNSAMVLTRLYSILKNSSKVKNKILEENTLFGTIDTWIVWKLTDGKVHATDTSNACVTGFFDPFEMKWAGWVLDMFGIPRNILPVIKNTCDSFGETLPDIFGASIPICSVVGDQQASLFGTGCFKKYDVNCTMGTGSFLKMNTGSTPMYAFEGAYPLVGWTISSETSYMIEFGVHDVGTILTFAQNLGLFKDPHESHAIAKSVPDSDDVYFLPGAIVSKSDRNMTTSAFIGLKQNTTQAHMVRSILEALAFQVCSLFNTLCKNYNLREKGDIRICGGIANNDFVIQLITDLTKRHIKRFQHNECSSLGAAFLAGLHSGVWKNKDEIALMLENCSVYSPSALLSAKNMKVYSNWKKAVTTSICVQMECK